MKTLHLLPYPLVSKTLTITKKFGILLFVNTLLLSACAPTTPAPTTTVHESVSDPCEGKNPAAEAQKWQGPSHPPYIHQDTFTNIPVKAGVKLYTLYPYGNTTPNFFVKDEPMLRTITAHEYHQIFQVAHKGNWPTMKYSMRTQLAPFMVKKDICMAMGKTNANAQFGKGGGIQYYIEDQDKDNLERLDAIIPFNNFKMK